MTFFLTGASRRALVVALAALTAPLPALAADTTVTAPNDTVAKSVTGTDTLTVQSGAALNTSATAVTWSGSSAAPGVVITNNGTIKSTGSRGIDTSGSSTTRNLTLFNDLGATISGSNDGFRINSDVIGGSILVDNAGTILSTGSGQAIDFDAISSATAKVTIINRATGVISSANADAVRPGEGGTVNNYGKITANAAASNSSNDGIDFQGHAGTVNNYTGGTITGARHGITTDVDVTVFNDAGATILGRNGSGVGSDGNGTVTNYGRITGAYAGVGNGDGDGVDIDFIGTIKNFGIIEGTGAGGVDSGGRPNGSEGIAIGGGLIENAKGALISGAPPASWSMTGRPAAPTAPPPSPMPARSRASLARGSSSSASSTT